MQPKVTDSGGGFIVAYYLAARLAVRNSQLWSGQYLEICDEKPAPDKGIVPA